MFCLPGFLAEFGVSAAIAARSKYQTAPRPADLTNLYEIIAATLKCIHFQVNVSIQLRTAIIRKYFPGRQAGR
jgi:hypothetical protein